MQPDTTVECAGEVWRGRIGNGADNSTTPYYVPTPVHVLSAPGGPPLSGAVKVAAGGISCALMQDSTMQCWGDSLYGQSGTGAGGPLPLPVINADGSPLTNVDALIVHHPHVCAHRTDGELLCWGRNLDGDLGDGTTIDRGFPTPLVFTCP